MALLHVMNIGQVQLLYAYILCYIGKLIVTLGQFSIKFELNDDEQLVYLGSLYNEPCSGERHRLISSLFTRNCGAVIDVLG